MTSKLALILIDYISIIICMAVFMQCKDYLKNELINETVSQYSHVSVGCGGKPLSCQPNNV